MFYIIWYHREASYHESPLNLIFTWLMCIFLQAEKVKQFSKTSLIADKPLWVQIMSLWCSNHHHLQFCHEQTVILVCGSSIFNQALAPNMQHENSTSYWVSHNSLQYCIDPAHYLINLTNYFCKTPVTIFPWTHERVFLMRIRWRLQLPS